MQVEGNDQPSHERLFSSSAYATAIFDLQNPSDLSGILGRDLFVTAPPPPVPFNPMRFLQDYMRHLFSARPFLYGDI
ncbi:hypothetical protein OPV22_024817 [Ensete ventricosum]|uniref:Uncharacterized protein n=1 Tax=Ensete ventricosum TaxID=4639 RepID=A0AAV8Q234_ENSVE|nr:hypothetical protein OPV22_024817 [Ensete ventricosum]